MNNLSEMNYADIRPVCLLCQLIISFILDVLGPIKAHLAIPSASPRIPGERRRRRNRICPTSLVHWMVPVVAMEVGETPVATVPRLVSWPVLASML